MYLVKGDYLECYGWKNGERLIKLDDLTKEHDLPEKFLRVLNIDRNETGGVLEYQIVKLQKYIHF